MEWHVQEHALSAADGHARKLFAAEDTEHKRAVAPIAGIERDYMD